MKLTVQDIRGILDEIAFQGYSFHLTSGPSGDRLALLAMYEEPDTLTNLHSIQTTREWLIPDNATKSQIVSTAFKCCMTSMEHRTREWFLYRNRAIYQPHYDVDQLHAISEERS